MYLCLCVCVFYLITFNIPYPLAKKHKVVLGVTLAYISKRAARNDDMPDMRAYKWRISNERAHFACTIEIAHHMCR